MLCVRWYLRYSLSYRDLKENSAVSGFESHELRLQRPCRHRHSGRTHER
jgi:transposase-like protein